MKVSNASFKFRIYFDENSHQTLNLRLPLETSFENLSLVITHDLRVLLEELEFFTQWMIRDGEDLVFPWVNYTSREMIDQYVFNYTFAAGEIIELSGQTAFRTYRIIEEAYIVSK